MASARRSPARWRKRRHSRDGWPSTVTTTTRPGATTSARNTPPARPTHRSCSPTPQRKRPSSWSVSTMPSQRRTQVAHARALAARGPTLMSAWLAAAHGETLAASGNRDGALRAFDDAQALLPADPVDPALPFLFLGGSHLDRWRGNALAQVGDPEAIDQLTGALAELPASWVRARAGSARRSRLRLRRDRQPRRRDEPRPGSPNDRPADQLRPPATAPRPPILPPGNAA